MEKSSYVLDSEVWESKFEGLFSLVKEYIVDVWKMQIYTLYIWIYIIYMMTQDLFNKFIFRLHLGKRMVYIYIYIYIYTFVRRARAVHARATRKRRIGRLRFNGQYNRLKTATLVLSCS